MSRGDDLWRDLSGDSLSPDLRVLLQEACRIADRLDKLDELLSGDAEAWMDLIADKGDAERQIVVIDKPLAEARQYATALKQIIGTLRAAGVTGKVAPPQVKGEVTTAGVADFASYAATRSTKTAG